MDKILAAATETRERPARGRRRGQARRPRQPLARLQVQRVGAARRAAAHRDRAEGPREGLGLLREAVRPRRSRSCRSPTSRPRSRSCSTRSRPRCSPRRRRAARCGDASRSTTTTTFKAKLDADGGFLLAHWCGDTACETAIHEETKATVRVITFDRPAEDRRVRPLRQTLDAARPLREGVLTPALIERIQPGATAFSREASLPRAAAPRLARHGQDASRSPRSASDRLLVSSRVARTLHDVGRCSSSLPDSRRDAERCVPLATQGQPGTTAPRFAVGVEARESRSRSARGHLRRGAEGATRRVCSRLRSRHPRRPHRVDRQTA